MCRSIRNNWKSARCWNGSGIKAPTGQGEATQDFSGAVARGFARRAFRPDPATAGRGPGPRPAHPTCGEPPRQRLGVLAGSIQRRADAIEDHPLLCLEPGDGRVRVGQPLPGRPGSLQQLQCLVHPAQGIQLPGGGQEVIRQVRLEISVIGVGVGELLPDRQSPLFRRKGLRGMVGVIGIRANSPASCSRPPGRSGGESRRVSLRPAIGRSPAPAPASAAHRPACLGTRASRRIGGGQGPRRPVTLRQPGPERPALRPAPAPPPVRPEPQPCRRSAPAGPRRRSGPSPARAQLRRRVRITPPVRAAPG